MGHVNTVSHRVQPPSADIHVYVGFGAFPLLIKENIKHYEEDNLKTKQLKVTAVCIQAKRL